MLVAINHQALRKFVLENAKDKKLIEGLRVFEHLRPFFDIAESGEYPLLHEEELPKYPVAEAISQATGTEVKKVIFVSVSELSNSKTARLAWVTDLGYLQKIGYARLRDTFLPDIQELFWIDLDLILRNDLEDGLRTSLRTSLVKDSVWVKIWYFLWYNTIGDGSGDKLDDRLFAILYAGLLYYVGMAIAGEQRLAEKVQPFIDLTSKAFPLGEKKGEKGTWVILVA